MPSLVTSIIGGIQGASAAHNAANAVGAGNTAAAKTVNDATVATNPLIGQAADKAGTGVVDASAAAGAGVNQAAGTAQTGATAAAGTSDARLDPYSSLGTQGAGTLATMLAPGGQLTKQFSGVDLSTDPGYQFRLQQGQQALERSAAAHGSVMGGGVMKALTDYAQGDASSEYQNAFNRFQSSQKQTYDMLKGVSDSGQTAATTQAGVDTGTAKYVGDVGIGAAGYAGDKNVAGSVYAGNAGINATNLEASNTLKAAGYTGDMQAGTGRAQAAGDVGAANAWSGMLSGIGTAANSVVAGGFGGGGGFNWTGALTGKPQAAGGGSGSAYV
jgi:uncharacterized protein YukE